MFFSGAPSRAEHIHGRLDHRRWSADVGVGAREVGLVLLDDVGDQADLAVPGFAVVGLRQRRDVAEVRQGLRQRVQLLLEAQVASGSGRRSSTSPCGCCPCSARERSTDEDRRHPGPAADEDHVGVASVAQREDTERADHVEPVADGQLGVQEVRELAVRVAPDDELELPALLAGHVGHRERPGLVGARDGDVDVLPGPERDLGRFDQLEDEVPHVVGDVVLGDDLGDRLLDRVPGAEHLLVVVEELDGHVLVDVRPAEQREALIQLEVGQREGRVLVELDVVTVEDERLAGRRTGPPCSRA